MRSSIPAAKTACLPSTAPFSMRVFTSSPSCHSQFRPRSATRLDSDRHTTASGGRWWAAVARVLYRAGRSRSDSRCHWPFSSRTGRSSLTGRNSARSSLPVRRWEDTSNSPMESTSRSQNSTRTGLSMPGENTSKIPPRRANWPTPSTCWHRV